MKFVAVLCIAAVLVIQVVVAAPLEEVVEITPDEVASPPVVREKRSYGPPPAPVYAAPPQISPPRTYSYQSPAPTIPCGQALVFSCAPSVAQAPCAAAAPSYGGY